LPLRIAFDLDGVLADMESELLRLAQQLFDGALEAPDRAADADAPVDPSLPTPRLNISPRQERRLWDHVGSVENFWETLKEIEPGAAARLNASALTRHWDVIFLTKRPPTVGFSAQRQSQRWLQSKGFTLPSVYVVQGSRGRIASALDLDVVVDDRSENCLDVVMDSKSRAILVWRDPNEQLPVAVQRLGIAVVRSVGECLDLLTELDAPGADRPGLFTRVLRAFARKQAT
jgi:deoxypyrimidine-specific 5' nucleotidase type C protein (NT5C)